MLSKFYVVMIITMMMMATWNMFSMSYFISLKVGRLPASHCQHSRIRLSTTIVTMR